MLKVYKHTFNPFMENTFVVTDETKECAIIDPGCSNENERRQLRQTIEANGLKPVKLLNTHCHIDHFPGNKFVCDTYGLSPEYHPIEQEVMKAALDYQEVFGFKIEPSPTPTHYLQEGDTIQVGNFVLEVLYTPGHSPGHLSFYCKNEKVIFSGDVLFAGSVGRYDLPGADGKTLFETITQKIITLPGDVTVYCGHGPETTIGREKGSNPFLNRDFFFGV